MIKVETLGMLDIAKINPVLKADKDVINYSFVTEDDEVYLVSNTITGDDSYKEDVVLKAGTYLNGYNVKAWEGQKLVVDGKHIVGGVDGLAKDTVLVVAEDGKLTAGEATGVHFVVKEHVMLTEKAVKVKIVVA